MLVVKMAALVECLLCLHFVGVSTVARCPKNTVGVEPTGKLSNTHIVVVVVSHIQRINCQPGLTTLDGGQSRSWSAEQRKKEKYGSSPPPPRCSFGENKLKLTRCIYIPRRCAGLGPPRVCTRSPSTRRLGQWVSLRKIPRFRVRLQHSQSRCLFLLLVMSSRVYFFFLPRDHEPPLTLRDRLNPHLSL